MILFSRNMAGFNSNWEIKTIKPDAGSEVHASLPLLATNRIAAIQIPNFFTQEELNICVENVKQKNISWYLNAEHKQGRIGISATEYHGKRDGKNLYFELEPESSRTRDEIFSGTSNPIQKIINLFSGSCRISIAREASMGNIPYFSGLIRAMETKSTLHCDYAPSQLPGWDISDSEEQFGLVLYLQMPSVGGELLIYDRPWVSEDDTHNKDILVKGPYGFDPAFLAHKKPTKVSPVAGDLIIFRSRNFHQVAHIDPDRTRLTINTFMSIKNNSLLLWS